MTDKRSDIADDAWIEGLTGGDDAGGEEARLIRASIKAHDELSAERISDEDVDAAKQRLLERLGSDSAAGEESGDSTVVDLSSRRSPARPTSRFPRNTGMLLAASVAFVAIVIMVLRNPDIPDGPAILMSYGEIDTVRGVRDENVFPVEDPDEFGRDLGMRLMEREIPFVLLHEDPESPDRVISIQVDGVRDTVGVQEVLDELGVEETPSSVATVRLIPEQ